MAAAYIQVAETPVSEIFLMCSSHLESSGTNDIFFFMLLFAFISSRIVKRIKQNRNNKISLQTTRNLIITIFLKECI